MAFFDQAQEMLSQGIDTARGAVSGVAMEQLGFVRGFVRLCNDGWEQGWHERNGGNATYRLTPEDVASCRSFFYDTASSWVPLGLAAPGMRRSFFLVTRAGAFMRSPPARRRTPVPRPRFAGRSPPRGCDRRADRPRARRTGSAPALLA